MVPIVFWGTEFYPCVWSGESEFVIMSSCSFPLTLVCPGTQQNVMSIVLSIDVTGLETV